MQTAVLLANKLLALNKYIRNNKIYSDKTAVHGNEL